jgi:hypothetical protein
MQIVNYSILSFQAAESQHTIFSDAVGGLAEHTFVYTDYETAVYTQLV